jgi:multisubunit Na+/H+ antiporter MnhB subunit
VSHAPGRPRPTTSASTGVSRSLILEVCVRLAFHAILATSLFFLFSGHNSPGGGFIGGLTAGSAFVLRYLVGSGEAVGDVRVRPGTMLGAGLLLAAGTAVVPWFLGGQVLESAYVYVPVPVVGEVPLTSVLVFDTGVFLIVVGIVLAVLTTLGAQQDSSLGEAGPDTPRKDPR